MNPTPMPDHWFQQYLAQCAPPGPEPHRLRGETLRLWRASIREKAQTQWSEAFSAGEARGAFVQPVRMEIVCDQQECRLASLVRKD